MSVPTTRPSVPTARRLRRRLAAWVQRPVVESFRWGGLTGGDVLTVAVAVAGLVLVLIAAIWAR
jgi:hypothetical protein